MTSGLIDGVSKQCSNGLQAQLDTEYHFNGCLNTIMMIILIGSVVLQSARYASVYVLTNTFPALACCCTLKSKTEHSPA